MSLQLPPADALILASSSPRRSELLSHMEIPFVVMAPDVDETIQEQKPEVVRELARRKAHAAACLLREQRKSGIVLAADTIVWCQGEILGKPRDAQDAARMLGSIAGCWHEVYTGVCVLDSAAGREETLIDRTRVRISGLSPEEISRYIATGEPMDKAGAYAIQGIGGMFIEEIAGSPSNVMGLPMAQTRKLLRRFGIFEKTFPINQPSIECTREGENAMPLGIMAPDIGIDLGTCNFRLSVKGKGIIIYEPTLAVVRNNSKRDILAIGIDAQVLLGRTSEEILTINPLVDSVIADFDMTELMLRYFIRKAIGGGYLSKPRMVITVPCGLTDVERRAVNEAARVAGARSVHIVDQPFAAAIGTGLPVYDPMGSMLVNIGGGTTEAVLISLNGIVVSKSIRVAGNKMDEAIVNYIKRVSNMLISERTAETLKIDLGSAVPPIEPIRAMVRGRDLVTGLPMTVEIDSLQIHEALKEPLSAIVSAVRWVLERTPPELAVDVLRTGIYLTGGSAQLAGMDVLIASELGIPVLIAHEASDCAALGVGYLAENVELISRIGKGDPLTE